MRHSRLGGCDGFGAMDLIALLLLIFLIWWIALQEFPRFAGKTLEPQATPAATSPERN